jgi:uncharacterized protein (UPF0276 family)
MPITALNQSKQTIRSTGIGLRTPHIKQLLERDWGIPWLEILTDNFISNGDFLSDTNMDLALLDAICERYPVTLHGVNLSLGGMAPLDMDYLKAVKQLSQRTSAAWISEHACFSHNGAYQSHDLLPLPYTSEAVTHMANRIAQVQDFLGEQILLENVSAYLSYQSSEMTEGKFLAEVAEQADCLLLLDVNNAYVNACNLGNDCNLENSVEGFFAALPLHRVKEIHLAGFADKGDYLLDAHNNPVANDVWALYQTLINQLVEEQQPQIPTLIEWDNDIPELDILIAEAKKADCYASGKAHREIELQI